LELQALGYVGDAGDVGVAGRKRWRTQGVPMSDLRWREGGLSLVVVPEGAHEEDGRPAPAVNAVGLYEWCPRTKYYQ
jgi:hypothetical protein